MIAVRFTPECQRLLHLLEINPSLATEAINIRHRGLQDGTGQRLIALGWSEHGPMTLVDARVTKATPDRFEEVTADLVIALRADLPTGRLTRDGQLNDHIMPIVASSFGRRIRPHATFPAQFWYSGPWDGKPPTIERLPREPRGKITELFVNGSFNPSARTCEMVWAFDLGRYRSWFTGFLGE